MNKKKIISETKAIVIIIIVALSVKVTILEAYIVPTGSMENTIMTGDFLIGSRFVYGMRTPDWIGIPYTDIGFFIPYIKFPEFRQPARGDILIFKYPRDKYVKYVKRCVAGPGDTLQVKDKYIYLNGEKDPMPSNGKFLYPLMPESMKQQGIFLSSDKNINKDHLGPIRIPAKGDSFIINQATNWRILLPLMLMEGHSAQLIHNDDLYEFTLQDPDELFRRKGKKSVYEDYFPSGNLITPWSRAIKNEHFQYLVVDGMPVSDWKEYTLKQNYFWAMGDNRDDSLDSRYWGFIPENFILGEALFVYFSLNLDSWTPRFERVGIMLR